MSMRTDMDPLFPYIPPMRGQMALATDTEVEMEAKHTPGPWKIEHLIGMDFGASAQITAPCGDGTPFDGRCIVVGEVWKTNDEIPRWSDDATGNANARLIAAAPDLLKACHMALDFRAQHYVGSLDSSMDNDPLVQVLRAAIARAES